MPKPVYPEAAKVENEEGLQAANKYWWEAMSYGYQTVDFSLVRAVTDADCENCEAIISSTEDDVPEGGWTTGGQITLKPILRAGFITDTFGQYVFDNRVTQEPYFVYDAAGKRIGGDPEGGDGYMANGWKFIDGEWKMTAFNFSKEAGQ